MSEPDVSALISVQQAMRIIDSVPVAPRRIRLKLWDADGFRLAQDLVADRDYPPFDKSQMDGYAVRRDDVANLPAELRVVGEIPAGKWPDKTVEPGQTMAIMTGAPMPAGAEGVVPIEEIERLGPDSIRVLHASGDPARYVAPRGAECKAGQVVLKAGASLGPAQIALAASIGADELDVFDPPKVAVLATGDELVPLGRQPGPSQIRNSNTPMLVSLLRRSGCDVTDLGVAVDQPAEIRSALERGLAFDALFVTGGMSMGEYDYVPKILRDLGVDLKITRLRIKPGKPFVFGTRENSSARTFVFGLPGNPVSGFVCTIRFALRLLARLAGGAVQERWVTGKLDTGLPANGPREFYQPALRTVAPGRDSSHAEFATITPLKWKGSADLITLAHANVLLVRPENDPSLPKGTVIRVIEVGG
ncbi:MAG TPA: gephyrin-like molybdotransferase Glp [Tepidisphaeraceae bacterium]|nr:gephyrin-like molybdotransferase Glp [Tepidisphaeraceae bacterium]